MRYVCLGYMEESRWDAMSDPDRKSFVEACFAYDDVLSAGGHIVSGAALESVQHATSLRHQGGRVAITDGPFAETKEQLGGIIFLEATDLNHAISLMSKHPSIGMGTTWEIRPTVELTDLFAK
jgi:hypothetical protein